jgi:hypothetical protein
MKNYLSTIWWWYSGKWSGVWFAKGAKVLDIGSGDKPFWRADVLVDKLDLGDDHRGRVLVGENNGIKNIGCGCVEFTI